VAVADEDRADGVRVGLGTIAREWGRIGCIGFGGPPTHITLLRQLCVDRRRWIAGAEFEDGIAATNLLPGPASTQLVGKTVIDTGKYHPGRDRTIPELEAREVTESELLQCHLTGAHVAKAFNNIFYQHLAALPWPADAADRTALPIASASAAEVTAALAAAQR
jgi:hypothetical protein